MAVIGNAAGQLQQVPIFNYEKSAETARSIAFDCNFGLDTIWTGNLGQERRMGVFQSIRSVYFNCRSCVNRVTITCAETQQSLTFEPGTQGYLPILISMGMSFRVVGTSPDVAYFNLLNVDMPPAIWPDAENNPGTIPLSSLVNANAQYDIIGRYSAGGGPWQDATRQQLLLACTDLANIFTQPQSINSSAVNILFVGNNAAPVGGNSRNIFEITGAANTTSFRGEGNTSLGLTRAEGNANGPSYLCQKARGTLAAPAVVNNSDAIFQMIGQAYTGSGYASVNSISSIMLEATPSPTALGAYLRFNCVVPGTATNTEILRLDHTGGLQMFGTNTVVDTNRGLRRRAYTFGTLPAGVAGAAFSITDGAPAPVWGANAAGGGAVYTPVIYNGAAYING